MSLIDDINEQKFDAYIVVVTLVVCTGSVVRCTSVVTATLVNTETKVDVDVTYQGRNGQQ